MTAGSFADTFRPAVHAELLRMCRARMSGEMTERQVAQALPDLSTLTDPMELAIAWCRLRDAILVADACDHVPTERHPEVVAALNALTATGEVCA